ncbi:hypothetical protein D8B34_02500 [Verminephrobacter eiseniae]|nr:hypothetical protein [Verminephrobacter eiseniae]MCW5294090.1 hypothetical protein [Verminephrobacter eiseniae]MCW8183171.1 hypothetical protein [Verminephrobacter eiseniae]MCW8222112.1 hypothetical protein [Verminephrobacter eiseniae]MCW8232706.1 hypothetical protein [Verminephrobacter eiseniae]
MRRATEAPRAFRLRYFLLDEPLAEVGGHDRGLGPVSHSIPESSGHFVGFACRTSVLSALGLRVHERFGKWNQRRG